MFSREDTPTEERVEAAFLYHLGLSYRQVGEWLGHSHQAVNEWYTALADLFEPEPDEHGTVVVNETKVAVEDRKVYVWAALDRHTYEVIHVEASPGRSDLDALLFLRIGLERCRGRAVIMVDCGPWYNWGLDDHDLKCERLGEKPGAIAPSSNPGSACSNCEPGNSSIATRTTVIPLS